LTVKVGERVEWLNHDPFPHTATATFRKFDSHEDAAGPSWKYQASKVGRFACGCSLHSTMTGMLRVE
jgi:plastocyanin